MAALSQLSYGPLVRSKCSGEVEVVCPIDSFPLVVTCWVDSQANARPIRDKPDRDEETAVKLHAIRRYRIYFEGRVRPPSKALGSAT